VNHKLLIFSRNMLAALSRVVLAPLVIVAATACISFSSGAMADDAYDYKLGPQDKISLKAFQWRETHADVFEWPALNGQFTVSASGKLSVPLVGQVKAAGLTSVELAKKVASRLRLKLHLAAPPQISIEVVEYRPFYVVGVVDKPGSYAYRPGLRILQALSIAGGLRRKDARNAATMGQNLITRRGEIKVLALEINSLAARKARLMSELKSAKKVSYPRALRRMGKNGGPVSILLAQETQIFRARKMSLDTQVKSLSRLVQYLRGEIKYLKEQIKSQNLQVRLIDKQLRMIKRLIKKRLTPQSRQLILERTKAEMISGRLRLETNLMKVKQDISRTEIAITEVRNKRANEVSTQLRENQSQLDKLLGKYTTAKQLLYDAEMSAPLAMSRQARDLNRNLLFKVVRAGADNIPREFEVTETMRIEPGDTLKVEMKEMGKDLDGETQTGNGLAPPGAFANDDVLAVINTQ